MKKLEIDESFDIDLNCRRRYPYEKNIIFIYNLKVKPNEPNRERKRGNVGTRISNHSLAQRGGTKELQKICE
jgi:hypothetical protein